MTIFLIKMNINLNKNYDQSQMTFTKAAKKIQWQRNHMETIYIYKTKLTQILTPHHTQKLSG